MLRQGEAGGQATARGRDEFPLIVMHSLDRLLASGRKRHSECAGESPQRGERLLKGGPPPPWRPIISQRSKGRICHARDFVEASRTLEPRPAPDAERGEGHAPLVRAAEHFGWTACGDVSLTRHARSVLTGSSTNIPPTIGTAQQARTSESVTRRSAGPCQKTAPIYSA
jgi:hypothetical protein